MKVCLDLCPRATILMVLCAHLGRPYLPEPALSALRMLREQGHSRDIWESELSLCLVPSKCPHNSKICDQNWNYAMLYEVKTRWAHASFSYMWYIPSRNGGWILTTVRPFASDTSLWVRVLSFLSCCLHAFSPSRPLLSTLPSSLPKLNRYKSLYPWVGGSQKCF